MRAFILTPYRMRRGGTLLWSVAALGLAIAMSPLYVGLCSSLSTLTSRGARRLVATQRGEAELERLRSGTPALGVRTVAVPELPAGLCRVEVRPAGTGLRTARVEITWQDVTRPGRAEWTTLVAARGSEGS